MTSNSKSYYSPTHGRVITISGTGSSAQIVSTTVASASSSSSSSGSSSRGSSVSSSSVSYSNSSSSSSSSSSVNSTRQSSSSVSSSANQQVTSNTNTSKRLISEDKLQRLGQEVYYHTDKRETALRELRDAARKGDYNAYAMLEYLSQRGESTSRVQHIMKQYNITAPVVKELPTNAIEGSRVVMDGQEYVRLGGSWRFSDGATMSTLTGKPVEVSKLPEAPGEGARVTMGGQNYVYAFGGWRFDDGSYMQTYRNLPQASEGHVVYANNTEYVMAAGAWTPTNFIGQNLTAQGYYSSDLLSDNSKSSASKSSTSSKSDVVFSPTLSAIYRNMNQKGLSLIISSAKSQAEKMGYDVVLEWQDNKVVPIFYPKSTFEGNYTKNEFGAIVLKTNDKQEVYAEKLSDTVTTKFLGEDVKLKVVNEKTYEDPLGFRYTTDSEGNLISISNSPVTPLPKEIDTKEEFEAFIQGYKQSPYLYNKYIEQFNKNVEESFKASIKEASKSKTFEQSADFEIKTPNIPIPALGIVLPAQNIKLNEWLYGKESLPKYEITAIPKTFYVVGKDTRLNMDVKYSSDEIRANPNLIDTLSNVKVLSAEGKELNQIEYEAVSQKDKSILGEFERKSLGVYSDYTKIYGENTILKGFLETTGRIQDYYNKQAADIKENIQSYFGTPETVKDVPSFISTTGGFLASEMGYVIAKSPGVLLGDIPRAAVSLQIAMPSATTSYKLYTENILSPENTKAPSDYVGLTAKSAVRGGLELIEPAFYIAPATMGFKSATPFADVLTKETAKQASSKSLIATPVIFSAGVGVGRTIVEQKPAEYVGYYTAETMGGIIGYSVAGYGLGYGAGKAYYKLAYTKTETPLELKAVKYKGFTEQEAEPYRVRLEIEKAFTKATKNEFGKLKEEVGFGRNENLNTIWAEHKKQFLDTFEKLDLYAASKRLPSSKFEDYAVKVIQKQNLRDYLFRFSKGTTITPKTKFILQETYDTSKTVTYAYTQETTYKPTLIGKLLNLKPVSEKYTLINTSGNTMTYTMGESEMRVSSFSQLKLFNNKPIYFREGISSEVISGAVKRHIVKVDTPVVQDLILGKMYSEIGYAKKISHPNISSVILEGKETKIETIKGINYKYSTNVKFEFNEHLISKSYKLSGDNSQLGQFLTYKSSDVYIGIGKSMPLNEKYVFGVLHYPSDSNIGRFGTVGSETIRYTYFNDKVKHVSEMFFPEFRANENMQAYMKSFKPSHSYWKVLLPYWKTIDLNKPSVPGNKDNYLSLPEDAITIEPPFYEKYIKYSPTTFHKSSSSEYTFDAKGKTDYFENNPFFGKKQSSSDYTYISNNRYDSFSFIKGKQHTHVSYTTESSAKDAVIYKPQVVKLATPELQSVKTQPPNLLSTTKLENIIKNPLKLTPLKLKSELKTSYEAKLYPENKLNMGEKIRLEGKVKPYSEEKVNLNVEPHKTIPLKITPEPVPGRIPPNEPNKITLIEPEPNYIPKIEIIREEILKPTMPPLNIPPGGPVKGKPFSIFGKFLPYKKPSITYTVGSKMTTSKMLQDTSLDVRAITDKIMSTSLPTAQKASLPTVQKAKIITNNISLRKKPKWGII